MINSPLPRRHLDREQAHEIETLRDRAGQFARLMRDALRYPCRGERNVENVMAMNIFADREDRRFPVRTPRHDHRNFLLEIDHLLEDTFRVLPRRPDGRQIGIEIDPLLAFAIVTKGRAFQNRRPADRFHRLR